MSDRQEASAALNRAVRAKLTRYDVNLDSDGCVHDVVLVFDSGVRLTFGAYAHDEASVTVRASSTE